MHPQSQHGEGCVRLVSTTPVSCMSWVGMVVQPCQPPSTPPPSTPSTPSNPDPYNLNPLQIPSTPSTPSILHHSNEVGWPRQPTQPPQPLQSRAPNQHSTPVPFASCQPLRRKPAHFKPTACQGSDRLIRPGAWGCKNVFKHQDPGSVFSENRLNKKQGVGSMGPIAQSRSLALELAVLSFGRFQE